MPYEAEYGIKVYYVGEPDCTKLAYKCKTGEIQNWHEVIEKHNASEPFKDAEFPHNDTSIGGLDLFDTASESYLSLHEDGWNGKVEWIRVADYIKEQGSNEALGRKERKAWAAAEPAFIENGLCRLDVSQGFVGDCWFVSALSEVVMDPTIANFIVPADNENNNDSGAYHFRFWYRGLWLDILVDDYLPILRTNNGAQLLGNKLKPTNGKVELWANLAEKAYAKLNGSYNAIDGNQPRYAFEALTGGIGEFINLVDDKPPPNLFEYLQKTLLSRTFVVFWTTSDRHKEEGEAQGLLYDHAYTVTGTAKVNYKGSEVKLIRFRNPHGCSEWTGKWSDQNSEGLSKEWAEVSQEEKDAIRLVDKDEGEFWMEYDDAIYYFYQIDICYWISPAEVNQPDSKTNMYIFQGSWRKSENTAGGQLEIEKNPQFVVDVVDDSGKNCGLVLSLMYKTGLQDPDPILGLEVYPVPDLEQSPPFSKEFLDENDALPDPNEGEAVVSGVYTNAIGYFVAPGRYLIIPYLYLDLEMSDVTEGDFCLRVITIKPE